MSLCAHMSMYMHVMAVLCPDCRSSILPLKNLQVSYKVQLHVISLCKFKADLSSSAGTNDVVSLCFSKHVV